MKWLVFQAVREDAAKIRGIYDTETEAQARRARILLDEDPYWDVGIQEIEDNCDITVTLWSQRCRESIAYA